MQVGNVGLAGADGVLGVTEDGGSCGLECGEVSLREGDEAVCFVFDVVFEEEVVLLERESGG